MSMGVIIMLASLGVFALLAVKVWFVVQFFKKQGRSKDEKVD